MSRQKSPQLPLRHWRWMWLGEGLRYASIVLIVILAPFYYTAKGIIWVVEVGGYQALRFRLALLILDTERSGWKPPPRVGPSIRLSTEWADKL